MAHPDFPIDPAEVVDLRRLAAIAGVPYGTAKKWHTRAEATRNHPSAKARRDLLPAPASFVSGNPWWFLTAQLCPWLRATGRDTAGEGGSPCS